MLEILLTMVQIFSRLLRKGASTNINDLPDVILSKILEDLPWKERLKVERICKKWQCVGKNLSWTTYKIFDNDKYVNGSEPRPEQLKPFFDRCGRHLRHLTLEGWTADTMLSFIKMAPNIQHLELLSVVLNLTHLLEIAQAVHKLKSLELDYCCDLSHESESDDDKDLVKCLSSFQFLEYLYLSEGNIFFHRKSAYHLPYSLKHLALCDVANPEVILHAAKECKNLDGLSLTWDTYTDINIQAWRAIFKMKNLKYLAVSKICNVDAFEKVLSGLPVLKVLDVNCTSAKVINAITKNCSQLECLSLSYGEYTPWGGNQISALDHQAEFLLLATLPNLRSISVTSFVHSKNELTELISKFVGHQKLQYITMNYWFPVDLEILFDILHHCKNIRSIGMNFGIHTHPEAYPKICQVVDDIDKERAELLLGTHPDVEIMCRNDMDSYKWLKIKRKISHPALQEKWHDSFLNAGKRKWATLYLTDHLERHH